MSMKIKCLRLKPPKWIRRTSLPAFVKILLITVTELCFNGSAAPVCMEG